MTSAPPTSRPALASLLSHPRAVRELGPGLFSALAPGKAAAAYDRKAALYDAIVGRSVYHRVFWGTSRRSYARFALRAVEHANGRSFAEVGCGSLLFTADIYRTDNAGPVVLVDRSLGMLRRGLRRLGPSSHPPQRVTLLHADAVALPFRSGALSALLSLNMLHVPCDRHGIVAEWGRMLAPGHGRLFVSTLIRSGRWSDWWLDTLHRAGEMGPPLTLDELQRLVAGKWGVIEDTHIEGNMCFIVLRHAATR